MKYCIVGFHSSGKQEVVDDLRSSGVSVGSTFTNIASEIPEVYLCNSKTYDNSVITDMFDNRSCVFLREVTTYGVPYWDGMSVWDFDQCQVFTLTPDQLVQVPKFPSEVCFIWLDSSSSDRRSRFNSEKRRYSFSIVEEMQREFSDEFISKLYGMHNTHMIYFNSEMPSRVSAIVQALVKHEDILEIFEKRYN